MEYPLISIIIPVYNVEPYLRRCLDSVINQTYKNLEIILIDDGSTDKSGEICEEYKKKDNRIIVIHQKNQGLSAARNAGLDIFKGEYVSFIDSDDYVTNTFIYKLFALIRSTKSMFSACSYNQSCHGKIYSGENLSSGIYEGDETYDISQFSSILCIKLFDAKLIGNLRFDTSLSVGEDYDFTSKFVINSSIKKVAASSEPLYYYVQREGSLVHSELSFRRIKDHFDSRRKYISVIKKYTKNKLVISKIFRNYLDAYYLLVCYQGNLTFRVRVHHYMDIYKIGFKLFFLLNFRKKIRIIFNPIFVIKERKKCPLS